MRYELIDPRPPISLQLSGCLLVPSIWDELSVLASSYESSILTTMQSEEEGACTIRATGADVGALALTYALLAWMKLNDWPLAEDWRTLRAARKRLRRRLRRRYGPTGVLDGGAQEASVRSTTTTTAPTPANIPGLSNRIAAWLLRQGPRLRLWGGAGTGGR